MKVAHNYNLVDQPWIPIVNAGRVSLRDIFIKNHLGSLGGNSLHKIALFKLLLAIAQAAYTPKDETEWAALKAEGLARHCVNYLDRWYDRFDLYGETPFLQMPAIQCAKVLPMSAVMPEIAAGNKSILTDIQLEKNLDDADKAITLLLLMGFPLGSKSVDNQAVLSSDYYGKTKVDRYGNKKPNTGKPGCSVGARGYLHNFLASGDLLQSIWLNLVTHEMLQSLATFSEGVGTAPWECMPESENCATAKALSQSLMGRLVPMSRFCLLTDEGLHYSDGIAHPDHKSGRVDPSVAADFNKKQPKVLWVNPDQRPWRYLTSLLSFMSGQQQFDCMRIRLFLGRFREYTDEFYVWSGGLRVSYNAGEQYASGSDDYVASTVWLRSDQLGEQWFNTLQDEMSHLNRLSKILYQSVRSYFEQQKMEGSGFAQQACQLYWRHCGVYFQDLLDACDPCNDQYSIQGMRQVFAESVFRSYNTYCPGYTARQLNLWAYNRPILVSYLKEREK